MVIRLFWKINPSYKKKCKIVIASNFTEQIKSLLSVNIHFFLKLEANKQNCYKNMFNKLKKKIFFTRQKKICYFSQNLI